MSRHQFSDGSENISSRQIRMPRIGTSGDERRAERALGLGMRTPHDQDRRADDHERQQRADVRQLGQDAERQEAPP